MNFRKALVHFHHVGRGDKCPGVKSLLKVSYVQSLANVQNVQRRRVSRSVRVHHHSLPKPVLSRDPHEEGGDVAERRHSVGVANPLADKQAVFHLFREHALKLTSCQFLRNEQTLQSFLHKSRVWRVEHHVVHGFCKSLHPKLVAKDL